MKYIAYYRVSTTKQGLNGLGIEAQKDMVNKFAKYSILSEFIEVESGKNDNRPELFKAIEEAKKLKAVLIVAKLDRLSRSLTFISSIMDAGIKFVCADMPEANEFTLHLFAALAQQERKMISERTKAALQVLKDRGVKLGKPENLTNKSRENAIKAIKDKANSNNRNVQAQSLIRSLHDNGLNISQITKELNLKGFKSSRGEKFHTTTVKRLLINKLF